MGGIGRLVARSRALGLRAAILALLLAAFSPSLALAQQPPAKPAAVTVTRAGNTLTATWDAPAGADTYHVTYSSDDGKSWTAAASPADGHSAASIDIANIDTTKVYIVGVRAGNAHGWSGWRNSAPNGPNAPPARPDAVSVTRADGTLTASWNAVSGADKYHVTYSSTGGESWQLAAASHTQASITISVDNQSTYLVGVRAGKTSGNDTLWSGWRNSPASAPFAAPPAPPAAPASVTLNRSCAQFTLSWTPVPGATGYDVNYSNNNRKSWHRTLSNVPQTVWIFATWSKDKTYTVAVRARNAGGESGWTNSAAAPPPHCEVGNLRAVTHTTHGAAGGAITATWSAGHQATAYNVNYRADGGQWQRIASNVSETTHTGSVTSTGGYTVAVQAVSGSGLSQWRNAGVAWLTAGSVTPTGATLTLAGHSGAWYVKKTSPSPAGTCSASIAGTTHALTTLSANTIYTYTAYSDAACANAIGSAAFGTGVSVSNLSETSTGTGLSITSRFKNANAFTTGGHSAGYTLQGVVFKFRDSVGAPGSFSAAIHAVSGGNPAASATYTLSGSSTPTTAGDYTYTCSGTCSLDKNTTYFLMALGTSADYEIGRFRLDVTQSDSETNTPSGAGWSIADRAKVKFLDNAWGDEGQPISFMFQVIAAENPTLGVSNVTSTTATLTIANHAGEWRYKADTGPHTACSAAQTGSAALSGLTAGTTYTYKAYSDANCADANLLATAAFTVGGESVSNMGEASNGAGIGVTGTFTEANAFTTGSYGSGYTLDRVVIKFRTSPLVDGVVTVAIHAATGNSPVASATYTLSGSGNPATAGDYTYTCSGTCSLDADTTYFLVISGTSAGYSVGYHQLDVTVSDNEMNTPSDAGWSIANWAKFKNQSAPWAEEVDPISLMFQVIADKNPTLGASGATASGAMLTIDYHSAQWWYMANTGPHATCQGPVAANTGSTTLTGLSPLATYTYSAYGASGCADANLLATAAAFTTGGVSVSNLSEASDGAGIGVTGTFTEANGFTTGNHGSGYTLDRVVIKFRTSPLVDGVVTVAIYGASGNSPAASATHTLSGSGNPATAGDYTYTCSGTCSLDKDTTYFLVVSGTSAGYSVGYHQLDATVSDSETNTPSDAGWSIANRAKFKQESNPWAQEFNPIILMFQVVATANS